MTPLTRETPFSSATSSALSSTFKGLFELTQHPSKALNLPLWMLPEKQRIKILRCCTLGAEQRARDTAKNN